MRSPAPRLSVLMPVKNAGTYLQTAVESILTQTFTSLELLVIDDGSTDGAVEALRTNDPRLIKLKNDGQGIVDALNAGARHARGDFLARMDADDIALPKRFEVQLAYLDENPTVGIAGGVVEIFSDAGEPQQGYRLYQEWINALQSPEDIERAIFIESPLPHPSVVFRREVFHSLGGYRDVGWAEDYDFWLRAHVGGIRMGKPAQTVLKWRDHPTRLSRTDTRYEVKRFLQAKAHYLAELLNRKRSLLIWGSGETGRTLFDELGRHRIAVDAFVDVHPRRIGGTKRGVPVIAPEKLQTFQDAFMLVAVAARGARDEIRDYLEQQDWQEGDTYLCVA